MTFIQPDSSSCVPTSFAYLVHKQFGLNFHEVLGKVLSASHAKFDLKANGMNFLQLREIIEPLGFSALVHSQKPDSTQYLVGVDRLPKVPYVENSIMQDSIKDGSLEITETHFVYPEGHAVAVFEEGGSTMVFDSFTGLERTAPMTDIMANLEKQPEFLVVESYARR
ncbi:MAG: hypothetical protein COY80_02045 [Candidatus Pacebacteria bacterium CG_4_10_14_0_8_um_filter_42_14]|nr:MAG: hypothetical protein COY80_02045 [Candidatus Pacebacteria bacterium CG_4_10_14_0_8_um_filter_42_14]